MKRCHAIAFLSVDVSIDREKKLSDVCETALRGMMERRSAIIVTSIDE